MPKPSPAARRGFFFAGLCYNNPIMPARDLYHDAVKNALVKDGWTITHDPIRLRLRRGKNLFVDLGAERLLAAEKGTEKIAVEIKSFVRASDMKDLEDAVGQFVLYAHLMQRYYPDYVLLPGLCSLSGCPGSRAAERV